MPSNPIVSNKSSFLDEVREKSGQPIELCFQCQKCAAGCSMGRYADYSPNQIIRLLQLGFTEKVLNSNMIWLCTSCEICGARCPNGINMAEVMDTLKSIAISRNTISVQRVKKFHDSFLSSVKLNGRVHETSMMALYKLKTLDLFSDIDLGMKMFIKGKLHVLPKRVKNRQRIKKIFANTSKKHT